MNPTRAAINGEALEIENAGVSCAIIKLEDDREIKVISNGMVDINCYVNFDADKECGVKEKVRFSVLAEILESSENDEEIKEQINNRIDELIPKHIIVDDIFASINYMNCLACGVGTKDDIDHLGNRRIRSVGDNTFFIEHV